MKLMKSSTLAIIGLTSFAATSAQAATVFLDNTPGGLGELLDNLDSDDLGTPAATIAVPGFTGLNITFLGITSSDSASGAFNLNSTSNSLGINSATDTSTERFEADFGQSVTFSFNQDVEFTQLDFTSFEAGEEFSFAGQTIANGDLTNGTTDIFDFSSPFALAANTPFTLQATSGTIGIEAMDLTVVPEPSTALLGAIGALALLRRRR